MSALGDVAKVTWTAMGKARTDLRFRIYKPALASDVWLGADGSWIGDATAKRVRRLAVLDPEDREQMEQLAKAWRDLADDHAELMDEPWSLPAMRMRQALRAALAEPTKETP